MKLGSCDNSISEGLESKTPKEKMDDYVEEIGEIMEGIYKLRPDLRQKEDKPFNEDAVDALFEAERDKNL